MKLFDKNSCLYYIEKVCKGLKNKSEGEERLGTDYSRKEKAKDQSR